MTPSTRISLRTAVLRAVALVVVLGLFQGVVSCRQILGIQERKLEVETPDAEKPATRATECGGFEEPSSECAKCLDEDCCDEAKGCAGDPACKAAYRCVLGCKPGDADCATWCLGSYSRPDSLAPLTACATSRCASACAPHACGALVNGSSTCDACVQANCCDENRACAGDEACVDIDFCSHRCLPTGSIRCSSDCAMTYMTGSDDSATRSACISTKCGTECSSDNAWTCLDKPQPSLKPPSLDPITFDMSVVEFLAETPYVGLTVKACSLSDLDCTSPLATTTTDDNGHLELTVPSGATGFNGFIDLSGSTLYPTLYYFLPPLIVGGDRGRLRLPSADTIKLLASSIKVDLDPTRGSLALVPWDCTLSPAPGVSFVIDSAGPGSLTYYFEDNLPNHGATTTAADPAIGGAVNIVPGVTRVRATVASLSTTISEFNFNIRAGTLTAGSIPPSP
ncbi:MAG TPA: hypothetical protein VH062_27430 [Polyangiaceae bacterium]|jgi:hypothetical protein|nr:hypothetical protein [Polyangiaceae bacterium]